MAWKTKINLDDRSTDVGTATATFTYPDGSTYVYTEQVEVKNDKAEFVRHAKNALIKHDATMVKEAQREAEYDAKFLEA